MSRKQPSRKSSSAASMMSAQESPSTVTIEETTVTIQRGYNYRVRLVFSQAPNGGGQFDNALYQSSLKASNCPEAVIQEDNNNKTEQKCAWTIYMPDDGYHTTISLTLSGQLCGSGWTGGASVNGLWGSPEMIY